MQDDLLGAIDLQPVVELLKMRMHGRRLDIEFMSHLTLIGPILRHDVLKIEDLQSGMILQGTVRNVVDFGAFVDTGIKQDKLVHISELADHFVKDPLSVVAVGQVVQVCMLNVDRQRGRVQLSMRGMRGGQ